MTESDGAQTGRPDVEVSSRSPESTDARTDEAAPRTVGAADTDSDATTPPAGADQTGGPTNRRRRRGTRGGRNRNRTSGNKTAAAAGDGSDGADAPPTGAQPSEKA